MKYISNTILIFAFLNVIFIYLLSNAQPNMIANENNIGSQFQLIDKLLPTKQLESVQSRLKRLISLSQRSMHGSQIREGEFFRKRQIMRNVKTFNVVNIFLQKLKQNAGVVSARQIKIRKPIQKMYWQTLAQMTYHLTIVYYYLAILCLLLLSGWNAAIVKFNQEVSTSQTVMILKILSLFALVIQVMANIWSRFLKHGEGLKCTQENIKHDIFSYNTLVRMISIILCIFFLIFPENVALSGVLYTFLLLSIIFGVSEASHLEAAYIHSKSRSFRWKIGKIFALNILMIHNVSIILIAMTQLNNEENWLIKNNLIEQCWQNQYISSYYWSTIILTTIGFGDISATNPYEQIIVSFLALFACGILAFNINSFSQIFGMLRDNTDQVELKIVMFRRMIKRDYKNNVDIDPQLKQQVYEYIESLSEERRQLQYVEKNEFLSSLPDKIRKDYYKSTNKILFCETPFLNFLRNETLSALTQKFEIQFLREHDVIQPHDLSIRILQEGKIDFFYNRSGATTENGKAYDNLTVRRRQSIRLMNSDFLTLEQQSNFGMRAREYSITWHMTTENFLSALKNDVADFEFYFSVLHKHSYDLNEWGVLDCSRCYSRNMKNKHSAFKCPNLTYMPIRMYKNYKFCNLDEIHQVRQKYKRHKDIAPRTSVLKYWKKYLKKNFELERKRDQTDHIKNIVTRSHVYFSSQKNRDSSRKSYSSYYTRKQKQMVLDTEKYVEMEVDGPFNFQFYMPKWNPCRLIFTQIEVYQDLMESSFINALRHVLYMKGQKFQVEDFNN